MGGAVTEESKARIEEDPRVEALLRVNAELAAEIRGLEEGRIGHPRSAASPSARRLGRLLADHEEVVAERDRLTADLEALRTELLEQKAELDSATVKVTELDLERERLVAKVGEYGELAEALGAEVGRLRGGVLGLLRRGAARATPGRRR
jgi:hypothetical protein